MSFVNTDNNKTGRFVNGPDSILAKKGQLPIALAQLKALKLKQSIPVGARVVVVFSANGNVDAGVTQSTVALTDLQDVRRVQTAKYLAHKVLNNKNREKVQQALAASVLRIVGPVKTESFNPSKLLQQEVRKVRLEFDRVHENLANMARITPSGPLETKCRDYLNSRAEILIRVMKEHVMRHLTQGSQRELQTFANSLLFAGIPRAIYLKLVQPNLIENLTTKLDQIVFGTKISKSIRLTYEEVNSNLIRESALYEMLTLRNQHTLIAASSKLLYEVMAQDLDEKGIKRLNKLPLLLVGPQDLSKDWANAQPCPPVPTGSVGEILLRINACETDFNSGILPMLKKAEHYWSGAVVAGKNYQGNLVTILPQVLADAKDVKPTSAGYFAYPRDANPTVVKEFVHSFRSVIGDHKEENNLTWRDFGLTPTSPIVVDEVKGTDEFSRSSAGKEWQEKIINRVFLKVNDERKPKSSGGGGTLRLGSAITKEIKALNLERSLQDELVAFLMRFQSVVLMEQAFNSFAGEIERMELDGSYTGPAPQEEEDEFPFPFGNENDS